MTCPELHDMLQTVRASAPTIPARFLFKPNDGVLASAFRAFAHALRVHCRRVVDHVGGGGVQVGIRCEVWRTPAHAPFLAVTMHWIDDRLRAAARGAGVPVAAGPPQRLRRRAARSADAGPA